MGFNPAKSGFHVEAILHSFLLVAASEMGDKTQLLALILAARYRRPWTVMAGILVATILNHWVAAYVGGLAGSYLDRSILKWILFSLFLAFAAWILIPDKDEEVNLKKTMGVFTTTALLFFLAEMGDKTQLATIALGAHFQNVYFVTAGTTLGMLFSDGLAVFFGNRLIQKISMKWIRRVAAILFAVFAITTLFGF